MKDITDKELIKYVKSKLLTTKTFDFYYPIYKLYDFPKDIALGHSTILHFEDLPKGVQDYFIQEWKHHFEINTVREERRRISYPKEEINVFPFNSYS